MPGERTRKRFAGDVIPVCTSFAIGKYRETVHQANRAKMMGFIIHNGSQTDSAIAWRSEADHVGQAAELSLCHMMVRHLTRDEGAVDPASGEDN
jgi:hypothetical protein